MRRAILVAVLVSGALVPVAFTACGTFQGTTATDAGTALADATITDSRAPTVDSAETDGGTETYSALSVIGNWKPITISELIPGAVNFHGSAFDGQYVYFTPYVGGLVVRYDTTSPVDASAGWSSHDFGPAAATNQWTGAAFDGRFLTLAPFALDPADTIANTTLVRYDTTQPFDDDAGAWQSTTLAHGFFAGAGRGASHVILIGGTSEYIGELDESVDASVSFLDTAQPTYQQSGGVFANGYFYIAPYAIAKGAGANALVLRVADGNDGVLEGYNYGAVENPNVGGYSGAVFDGRYVYFVPYFSYANDGAGHNIGYHGLVLRYDTLGAFNDSNAWQTFNIPTTMNLPNARGFAGGVFDGKYVYFAPDISASGTPDTLNSTVVRFDTTGTFTEVTSWEAYDLKNVATGAGGFFGAVFDGEYIYFVPSESTLMLRFDARTPKVAPTIYPGSP